MVGQHGTTELDHGLFQGPPLRLSVVVTYAIASLGFLIALALFTSQFSIPDVPALEDVEELRSFDDIQQLDSTQLKDAEGLEAERAGWGNAYAAEGRFAVMEATLTEGVLAVEECVYVEDEDGGHWSKRSSIRVEPSDGFTIRDRTGLERTVRYGFEDGTPTDLPVVLGFAERSCNGAWSERISGAEADSLVLFLLIEEDPERIQVLSIQEVGVMEAGNPPNSVAKEVTAREDRGRWALVGTGIAGFFVMVGTPTSLSTDLRRLRKARAKMAKTSGGAAGVLGATGRPFQHLDRGSTEPRLAMGATRPAKEDWILPPPPLPNAYTDFFIGDPGEQLLPEHPGRIGTPVPATFTFYSIGGIVFALSFVWLAADLRAREGSATHTAWGWAITFVVTVVNLLWFRSARRAYLVNQAVRDTPTTPIRSLAVGHAEVVGQARPSPIGTPQLLVDGDPEKCMEGLVYWHWKCEELVCRTDGEGNTTCTWELRREMRTGVPFIVHDGTAGMLFDPRVWDGGGAIQAGTEEVRDTGAWMRLWSWFSLLPFFLNRILGAWRKKELGGFGSVLRQWNQGNFRWQVTGIGVGDPVYLLGNVVPRTAEDLAANGTHPTAQSALLTMTQSKDGVGNQSLFHLGTELTLLGGMRSTMESIIIPSIVLIFSIVMFVNYG